MLSNLSVIELVFRDMFITLYSNQSWIWQNWRSLCGCFLKLLFLCIMFERSSLFLISGNNETGFMTRCRSQGGWFQWEAAPTEVDTTTTPTQWFEGATELSQWTSTSLDALQPLRHCSMDSSSFRRKSTGARISCTGGTSDQKPSLPMPKRVFAFSRLLPKAWVQ